MPFTGPLPNVYTNAGQSTGPAANAVIATVTVSQGVYAVVFGGYLSGSGFLAADADNMAIQSDPVTLNSFVTAQVLLIPPASSVPVVLFRLPVYALGTIRIIAVANATATVVYHASIATNYPGPSGSLL